MNRIYRWPRPTPLPSYNYYCAYIITLHSFPRINRYTHNVSIINTFNDYDSGGLETLIIILFSDRFHLPGRTQYTARIWRTNARTFTWAVRKWTEWKTMITILTYFWTATTVRGLRAVKCCSGGKTSSQSSENKRRIIICYYPSYYKFITPYPK